MAKRKAPPCSAGGQRRQHLARGQLIPLLPLITTDISMYSEEQRGYRAVSHPALAAETLFLRGSGSGSLPSQRSGSATVARNCVRTVPTIGLFPSLRGANRGAMSRISYDLPCRNSLNPLVVPVLYRSVPCYLSSARLVSLWICNLSNRA